ncbi:putative Ig domain-containing protein, partial [Corynebacterium jeddahense]
MAGQHRKATTPRRGTSLAACALGLSLVAGVVQPVAMPHLAGEAQASDASASLVNYGGTTTVRFGQTSTLKPNVNRLTVHKPTHFEIAGQVPSGWGVKLVDASTGELSVTPDLAEAENLSDTFTIPVLTTWADGSRKVLNATVALAPEPAIDPVEYQTFWAGKEIHPVHIRAVKVPSGSKLGIQSGLPDGLTVDDSRALNRYQHVYLKGAPSTPGVYTVTAAVSGTPTTKTFTITVKDPKDLPAPTSAELAPAPQDSVEAGQPLNIPVDTSNASSVEVSGLPDGMTYDSENSVITGTPTKPGSYEATVDIITKDDQVLQDKVPIVVKEPTPTTSEQPTTEPSTSEQPTPTTEPSTSEPSTSEPSTSEPSASEQPTSTTTKPSTTEPTSTTKPSASVEPTTTTKPSTSEPTSTTKPSTSVEPTTTTKPSTTEPSTSEQPTSTTKPTTTT